MNFPCRFAGRAPGRLRAALCFIMIKIQTNVFIDGFNFYYGCVKGTSYRWLDFSKLCAFLFPRNHINHIRYFTAPISVDPLASPRQQQLQQAKRQRQVTYLRALKTIPNLSIHEGHFKIRYKWMPLTYPLRGITSSAKVTKQDEKGSDVNLATYLLIDGFNKEYEMAVVISNDSDLTEPIRLVRSELGLRVGIRHPYYNIHVSELAQAAEFYKPISEGVLQASQFLPELTDAHGTIHKPKEW